MVMMAAASNLAYRSMLSPPRLAQLRQAVKQHFETFSADNDPLFLLWGHSIAAQAKLDPSLPGAMQSLYKALENHEILRSKGEKVARCRIGQAGRVDSEPHWLGCS